MTASGGWASAKVAWAVLVIAGLAFVVLAWQFVPWQPAPGGRITPAPAASVFSAAEIARAEQFSQWARVWSWSSLLVSLVVSCGLGFTSLGPRLVRRLPGRWWLQVPQAVGVVLLVGRLATLPMAVAQRLHRQGNGLSTQSWSGFVVDLTIGLLVGVVVTSLGLVAVMACARRWPRAWPALAGSSVGVLVLIGSYAYPVLIEPLYNSFEPLPAGALRSEILQIAEQEGIGVSEVLVADASRRTTTLNAYVSGFGDTRRVVVYDNLVEQLPADQAISVIAHELAHARHDDVLVGSTLGATGAAFAVGLLGLLMARSRTGEQAGRRRTPGRDGPGAAAAGVDQSGVGRSGVGQPAWAAPTAVPRVLALLAVATLLASPIQNTISRQIELRADVDALGVTGDSTAFIETQRQLALRSLGDPTPPAWSQFWFGSHPTTLTRIALAERMRTSGR